MKDPGKTPPAFVLRFDPLFGVGPALSFPCDAAGRVDLDTLAERARSNYFYARAVIGRHFGMPAVQPGTLACAVATEVRPFADDSTRGPTYAATESSSSSQLRWS